MDKVEVKLSVKNLKISFRTDGGKLQAVRGVNFDLYKGETLAIVGESGSGKSVTTRAVMGILAPNAIKESGEIAYDGQDLTKISEEDFQKIRGDRVAMIFQDPLSSLNPIMRVGRQLTEAMLVKGKASRKKARNEFNRTLSLLRKNMDAAAGGDKSAAERNRRDCKIFNLFEYEHLRLENKYNIAKNAAEDALGGVEYAILKIEKKSYKGLDAHISQTLKTAKNCVNEYVLSDADGLFRLIKEIKSLLLKPWEKFFAPAIKFFGGEPRQVYGEELKEKLESLRLILLQATKKQKPNFFAMGYVSAFANKPIPDLPVEELNAFLRKYLDENFMLAFISRAKQGIKFSAEQSFKAKKAAIEKIDAILPVFGEKTLKKFRAKRAAAELERAVNGAIDKLETVKDNVMYTFKSSLESAVDGYFAKTNQREEITGVINRVREHLQRAVEDYHNVNFDERTVATIDFFKEKASAVVVKITRRTAKLRALKLLEEVGIPEPRKRFKQYPFELSGGMRQRIVIAVALSANPDVLICDEPTTALDVTIQAQILELIQRVKADRRLSVIFITHDLGVVASVADRVAVMYAGKIVETGTVEDIFYRPAHPYTWALLSSMPDLDTREKLEAIVGSPPNMIYPPKGDAFAARNKYAMKIDFECEPPTFEISPTHSAATWLLHPNAPKVDPPAAVRERIERMRAREQKNGR